jgi:hypothetical protein
MRIRADKLAVNCYALHGDICSIAPHCRSLGCASGFWADDYVLVARFAYLQEAIDYCLEGSERGVRMKLISRLVPNKPFVSDYPKKEVAA